ncbi:MAG: hypothetical protein PWP15_1139 [Methanothermococcus sp.]|uniref:hypothetical protein n=1 Tax=Methanothermococcus sp. TaxID=2614238 RepID=UPI002585AAE4|nr:hypothetical protein [Methanothermococcus sp.]MDK2790632.1 hypothetical protein [Methanothermococcus sp.]
MIKIIKISIEDIRYAVERECYLLDNSSQEKITEVAFSFFKSLEGSSVESLTKWFFTPCGDIVDFEFKGERYNLKTLKDILLENKSAYVMYPKEEKQYLGWYEDYDEKDNIRIRHAFGKYQIDALEIRPLFGEIKPFKKEGEISFYHCKYRISKKGTPVIDYTKTGDILEINTANRQQKLAGKFKLYRYKRSNNGAKTFSYIIR